MRDITILAATMLTATALTTCTAICDDDDLRELMNGNGSSDADADGLDCAGGPLRHLHRTVLAGS
jgi:hypothetical protein